jgi:hypothetical protein
MTYEGTKATPVAFPCQPWVRFSNGLTGPASPKFSSDIAKVSGTFSSGQQRLAALGPVYYMIDQAALGVP